MATRIIKPTRDDTMLSNWQSTPEVAPSSIRKEGTLAAQIFLFVGFFFIVVGALSMLGPVMGWTFPIPAGLGYVTLTIGLVLTLYHCYVDPEPQFRRLYALGGVALVALGIGLRVFPAAAGLGAYFLPVGAPLLLVALFFLIGAAAGETDDSFRNLIRNVLLAGGGLGLVYAILRGFFNADFLAGEGVIILILGMSYVLAYLGLAKQPDAEAAYLVTLGLGLGGAVTLIAALAVSWSKTDFFIPAGLTLAAVGLFAVAVAVFAVSDWPTFVIARRELMSYFYSPVAYLVIFGLLFMFAFNFYIFGRSMTMEMRGGIFEPITESYVVNIFPVIAVLLLVPVLTMRLFSEETRSGSLEVLMTAPVSDFSIVMGKFLAAWVFYLVAWSPYFLFMVGFRVFGDASYDYRPLLSFFFALAATGAGFLAIGLFFSSLTSNQIVAAVLTFAALLMALGFHWLRGMFGAGTGREFFSYLSFIELWWETSKGYFPVRYFVLHLSVAVFFIYLTTLALGMRKWK